MLERQNEDGSSPDGLAVVSLSALPGPRSAAALRDRLLGAAARADTGVALLLDDDGDDPEVPQSALVAAWTRMATWPGVPLVIVVPKPTGTLPSQIPTVPDLAGAAALVQARDRVPRVELPLSVDRFSPRRARVWIREQLEGWRISDSAPAELVATELVDNAIIHAGSIGTLELRLRPELLSLSLGDRSEQRPRLVPPEERTGHGRGLVIVDQLCEGWGSSPREGGGKVVWANLPLPPG